MEKDTGSELFRKFYCLPIDKAGAHGEVQRGRRETLCQFGEKLTVKRPGREVNLPGKPELLFYLTSVIVFG
jgi:hypothetical protein